MERSLPEHRAQTREIVIERIQHAKPIAAAVDFKAFEGGQTIVRFEKPGIRIRSDSIGAAERLQDRIRHASLYVEKGHEATATGEWIYFSALSASACTSSKHGTLPSH